MTNQPDKRLLALCEPVTLAASVIVMLAGGTVLSGWLTRTRVLTSFAEGQAPMRANAAIAFLLGGFSLWCLRKKRSTQAAAPASAAPGPAKRELLGRVSAGIVVAIGLITLFEHILDTKSGIDELIFKDAFPAAGATTPGRMAPTTALNFVAIGMALLLLDLRWAWPVEFLVLTAAPIALTGAMGFLFNAKGYSGVLTFSHMALHSSLTFLVWSIGVLCSRPDRGIVLLATLENPGSILARRLLPLAVVIPLVIGWFSLLGLRSADYSAEFAMAVYTLLTILIFAILIRLTARSLFRADAERRKTEGALSQSEERFRAQFQNSPIPSYTWEWNGNDFVLKAYNDAASNATRGKVRDYVGISSKEMYPDMPEIPADMRRCMTEGAPVHREMLYRFRSSAEQKHVSVTYGFIPPGLILVHAIDVTEKRKAVEQIRFQAHLLDTVAQAVIATDLNGRITYWNRFAETLYGWSAADVIGRHILDITIPEELQKEGEEVLARLRSGQAWSGEFQVRRRDGSTFTAAVFNAPVRNEEQEVVGIIGISSDVTHQKRLEDQLRQSQKLEAIGQLAGGIAHDFSNVLTVIQGNLDLMLMKPGDFQPEARHSLQEIADATKRAGGLTRQLLTFSRKQQVQLRALNLNLVIDEMMKMIRRLIGEDIQLTLRLAQSLPMIRADAGMIEQILLNLAVNARDAMPTGGRLIIGTQKRLIDDVYARTHPDVSPGQYACLTVTDTGCGIPAENLTRIFEPFFTTKAPGKGTGLGLATVFGVVKQHKGWIQVYSKPGSGTGFQVFLPVTEDSPAAQADASWDPTALRGSETILVVEDELALRDMVRAALQQFGYRVLEATSGPAALEVWSQHKNEIALVFTDMLMPGGISGWDLGKRLRAENPQLKVIHTSGYAAGLFEENAVLEEDANFLQKPYNPLALARSIRTLLDKTSG